MNRTTLVALATLAVSGCSITYQLPAPTIQPAPIAAVSPVAQPPEVPVAQPDDTVAVPQPTKADFDEASAQLKALNDKEQTDLVSGVIAAEIPVFTKAGVPTDGMATLALALHDLGLAPNQSTLAELCTPANEELAPRLASALSKIVDDPWTANTRGDRTEAQMAQVDMNLSFASGYLSGIPTGCSEAHQASSRLGRHGTPRTKGRFNL